MKLVDIWNLLPKALAGQLVALITLQQALIAMATWSLGEAGLHVGQGSDFLLYLLIFLALSLLPQALTIPIRRLEARGYWDAYGAFVSARLLRHARQASIWRNHQAKESFLTAIGPEAESYITAVLFSLFDIYLFALTIVLNVAALALVVDGAFPYAFGLAAVLSYAVFLACAKRITRRIEAEQERKLDFFSYLLKSWDNVFLNNPLVENRYRGKLLGKFNEAGIQTGKSRAEVELSTFALTLVSHLPVFGWIAYLAYRDQGDMAALTALLVTIPRQLYVLTNFKNFFEQINSLIAFKSRVQSAWKGSELQARNLDTQIRVGELRVNDQPVSSLQSLLETLATSTNGRFVLTGRNGAGKSTLLLSLSQRLPLSFYLPSNPHLEIGEELGRESTGERILKHLRVAMGSGVPCLLLDEWDANLDADNRGRLHQELERIARDHVVIEVRHHG